MVAGLGFALVNELSFLVLLAQYTCVFVLDEAQTSFEPA